MPIKSSRGVALILVIFVVALATIIVVNLTQTTYMASRANEVAEHSLQSEYILKSLVNLARILIKLDDTTENSRKDPWGSFTRGLAFDPKLLGISEPGLSIEVEIDSEDAKIPLLALIKNDGSGNADERWRDILACLFQALGFDEDKNEVSKTGTFANRFFNSQQLVANLIDYMSPSKTSYDTQDFAKGIESELPESETFKNAAIDRLDELANIPGFTPRRLQKVMPYLTSFPRRKINVNLAATPVLKCLHTGMTDQMVEQIVSFRDSSDGPFSDQTREKFKEIVTDQVYNDGTNKSLNLLANWGEETNYFSVLAKLDYGASAYFMRAYVKRTKTGDLPLIMSIELF